MASLACRSRWSDIEKGQVDESVSVHVEGRDRTTEQWKSAFKSKLSEAQSPLPFSCCIFKVPEVLRRQKKQAYEPDVVSIGPFHRGGENFKLVENVKEWYLKTLLSRTDAFNLDSLTESIKGMEKKARGCYSDPCNDLDQNDFIEMLILDGCFLIELFRKVRDPKHRQDNDDPIFNLPCMLEYLYHDLLLLENQIPWFVLDFFYNKIELGNSDSPDLSQVVIDFFKDSAADNRIFSNREPNSPDILHILDLIRTSLVQKLQHKPKDAHQGDSKDHPPTSKLTNHLPQRIPSAASLSEAGVKFQTPKEADNCILNITFERGVFTIPPLTIDERTDPLFRNLMAFEQCYDSCKHKITSYAVLMDNLIDTNEDVNLLCEKEIVANWLSADDASKFFNDLYTDTTVIDYVYKELSEEVHNYHRAPWNRWREKLIRDYFSTPWTTISFFAAFVLLVLTFLQTVYTLQQYYHPP